MPFVFFIQKNNLIKLKIKYIYILAIFIIATTLLFIVLKFGTGYYSPDEIFYTNPENNPENLSIKFLATKFFLTFIHSINRYLLPLINVFIKLIILRHFYINYIKESKTLSYNFVVLVLCLPSVMYLSSAYLRDFYVYVAALFLFYPGNFKKSTILFTFLFLFLLRYEAGLIFIASFIIDRFFSRYIPLKLNRFSLVLSIIIVWLSGLLLLQNEHIFKIFRETVSYYEKTTIGFSVFQLPVTFDSIVIYSFPNWVAYWGPFFFRPVHAMFDYFLALDAVIVFILIIRAFVKFNKRIFIIDSFYRIATFIFLFTFFISLLESLPSTIFRHHIAYVPALLYLNFPVSNFIKK